MQVRDLFNEFPLSNRAVVPLAVQQLLKENINVCDDWERAERLLMQARALMPGKMEINVALYKMYAYSNRFDDSLLLINEVLDEASKQGGFARDWLELNQECLAECAEDWVRFYLYSMKATGFVLLRKGEIDAAHEVLKQLIKLDPLDEVGGTVVYHMAERILENE